jgi:hypothetical protein
VQIPRLLFDPVRLATTLLALFLGLTAFLSWASASGVRSTVTYEPIRNGAEGILLIAFSALLILWALHEEVANATSRSVQLAGPFFGLVLVALTVTTESAIQRAIFEWQVMGFMDPTLTWVVRPALAGSLAVLVLAIWIDMRRPRPTRERTRGVVAEWGIRPASIVRGAGAVVGAILGAAVGLAIGVFTTNGWAYAALLFILLCGLGIAVGGRLGSAAGGRVVRSLRLS